MIEVFFVNNVSLKEIEIDMLVTIELNIMIEDYKIKKWKKHW